jgi:hypothetical protein
MEGNAKVAHCRPRAERLYRWLGATANETTQPRPNHDDHFEPHVRMLAAEVLKILTRNEQNLRVFQRRRGRRVIASVKDGEFCKRAAGTLYGKGLARVQTLRALRYGFFQRPPETSPCRDHPQQTSAHLAGIACGTFARPGLATHPPSGSRREEFS